MNTNTGELKRGMDIPPELANLFTPVPDELVDVAMALIDDSEARDETAFVDLKGNSALARWAVEQNTARKKSEKRRKHKKMAKLSRRRNR